MSAEFEAILLISLACAGAGRVVAESVDGPTAVFRELLDRCQRVMRVIIRRRLHMRIMVKNAANRRVIRPVHHPNPPFRSAGTGVVASEHPRAACTRFRLGQDKNGQKFESVESAHTRVAIWLILTRRKCYDMVHLGLAAAWRRHPHDASRGESMAKQKEKEEALEVEGVVVQALANTRFRVEIEGGHIVNVHIAGRMRRHFIRIVPGDKVRVELSPYDLTKGRITYRER